MIEQSAICAISSTVGANFIADPGLHRTLPGDGLATSIASLRRAGQHHHGENTGVLALTRVYDPLVIRLAAVYAIIASFARSSRRLVSAMPTGTIGGFPDSLRHDLRHRRAQPR